MMDHPVHLALQIVPLGTPQTYSVIDRAIDVIRQSGVRFTVGPMETVLEGNYNTVMAIAREAQVAALEAGADELVVTLKLHIRKSGPVLFDEKGLHRQRLTP